MGLDLFANHRPTGIQSQPEARPGDLRPSVIEGAIDHQECDRIRAFFDFLQHDGLGKTRIEVQEIPGLPDLQRRLCGLLHMTNETTWRFDMGPPRTYNLSGLVIDVARPGSGSVGWHNDYATRPDEAIHLKLNAVVQLSAPSEYHGADLEFYTGQRVLGPRLDRGDMVVFPSFMLHRRLPVTHGCRVVLIAAAFGPAFR